MLVLAVLYNLKNLNQLPSSIVSVLSREAVISRTVLSSKPVTNSHYAPQN